MQRTVRFLLSFVVFTLLTTAVFAQDDISSVSIVATDDGVDMPSEIPAGYVRFNIENNRSEAEFGPILARLNEGVTMDDFMTAVSGEDPMGAVMLVTLYGGTGVEAGSTLDYISEMSPGDYVLLEFEGEGFASFTVTGDAMDDVAEPESDVTMALLDFGFGVPAFVPAGPQVWHITNIGMQWHEISMVKAPDGINSVADARAAMAAGDVEEPEQVLFWAPTGAGTDTWITLDLEPGTYVLLCFLPDLNGDFSPHMDHGMMQVFVVE